MEYCLKNEEVKIEIPVQRSLVEFKNFNRSIRVPFIVYEDFESLIKPISGYEPKNNKS